MNLSLAAPRAWATSSAWELAASQVQGTFQRSSFLGRLVRISIAEPKEPKEELHFTGLICLGFRVLGHSSVHEGSGIETSL